MEHDYDDYDEYEAMFQAVDPEVYTEEEAQIIQQPKQDSQQIVIQQKPNKPLAPISIKYPYCSQGGFHQGQALNLYCTESKCSAKPVICSFCYDEQHSTHKVKPVKIIIQNARKYLSDNNKANTNIDKVQELINKSQKKLEENYTKFCTDLNAQMTKIKSNIKTLYSKTDEEIESKLVGQQTQTIIQKLQTDNDLVAYKNIVKDLVAQVRDSLESCDGQDQITQNGLKESIQTIKNKLQKQLNVKGKPLNTKIEQFLSWICNSVDSYSLFNGQSLYVFGQTLHHPGVSLVNMTTVTAQQGNNYHFALMEPSLEIGGDKVRSFQFNIVQNLQSWVAVGVCHKETIVTNGFNFNYSSLGHGGYLISANGGSWSTLQSHLNNVVTSFSFVKGDIIVVKYDPKNKTVTFQRKDKGQTHSMQIQFKKNNELHLCVLFYYKGDKVQYLGPSKS